MKQIIVLCLAAAWGCTAATTTTEPKVAERGDVVELPPVENREAPADIECHRDNDVFGPVLLDEKGLSLRHGHGVARFSGLKTSKEQPAEVCGVGESLGLLMAMRCDDGSGPFENHGEAHAARAGNMGPGGRCGSMVDLYNVACPEGSYEVYIDMYMCNAEANAFLE